MSFKGDFFVKNKSRTLTPILEVIVCLVIRQMNLIFHPICYAKEKHPLFVSPVYMCNYVYGMCMLMFFKNLFLACSETKTISDK